MDNFLFTKNMVSFFSLKYFLALKFSVTAIIVQYEVLFFYKRNGSEGSLPGVVVIRVSASAAVKEKATPPKRQRPSRKHLSWIRILPHSSAQTYTRKHTLVHAHPTNSPTENTEEADSGREKPNVHVSSSGELLPATSNA